MKLQDHYQDEDTLCLVMDLMTDDLRNIVNNNNGPLEEAFAQKLFKQMIEAVHYCHQIKIVHRDIKLENFLIDLDQETNTIQIKLTDFGLSKKI